MIFWGKKLKSFSGKANQSLQNGFILMFARGSILEIGFEATLKSKTICSKRLKIDFYFPFHIFQWTSSKCFWGKKDETYKTVNPKSDIENVLENGFGTTLWSKADVLLNLWKKKLNFSHIFKSTSNSACSLTMKPRQSVQKSSNPKWVMVNIWDNSFEATR